MVCRLLPPRLSILDWKERMPFCLPNGHEIQTLRFHSRTEDPSLFDAFLRMLLRLGLLICCYNMIATSGAQLWGPSLDF